MDNSEVSLVNLPDPQKNFRMITPDLVNLIRELSGQGLEIKRIARSLGIFRNSVRRFLARASVGFQARPEARRLDAVTQEQVQRSFETVAEGNTVVVQQKLADQEIDVDLGTLRRAVAPLRQAARQGLGHRPVRGHYK